MLLVCDQCGTVKSNIFMLPFAMYIDDECISFPKNEEAYMNLCFDCISGNSPFKEMHEQ